MAKVVCVHGIRQQHKAEDVLAAEWSPGLRGGLRLAGSAGREAAQSLKDTDLRFVFYGDLFRTPGRPLSLGDPYLTPEDTTDFDRELLFAWWEAAAEIDPTVIHPGARTLAPRSVQAALRALSGTAFFAGVRDSVLLGDLVQVRKYLTEPEVRKEVQRRVAEAVDSDTRVIVGHSLGSVVAYEALCAHPEWPVRALVTLGSPLGIRNLIFDRLVPAPAAPDGVAGNPVGQWPGRVETWTNIADERDIVALVKDLRIGFGEKVACHLIDNGATHHAIQPYLTAKETGVAILAGLVAPADSP